MRRLAFLVAAISTCATPMAASARTVTVTVDARCGPWSTKANPGMPFGLGDAAEPAVVTGLEPDSGKIEIYPAGHVSLDDAAFDSVGDQSRAVDDTVGRKKRRFPSFYTPKILYPAFAHGLIATFVDAEGKVVGRPFMVGAGVRVAIPERATAIAFGLNDDSFAANKGSFIVRLVLPD